MHDTMTADEFTISERLLDVGNGHKLYIHDWGNRKAESPVIFLHGGPGGSVHNKNRQLFDPAIQRVIFFDQRGAGQSTPKGDLQNNTTIDLINDIEKVADHFKLRKFILTGGSWGSYLALAYGIKYPQRVKAMVLRGIFTGSKEEIEWIDQGRFKTFYPEVWEQYVSQSPEKYRKDPSKYLFEKALGNDAEAKKAAYAYENLEGALLNLDDRYLPADFKKYDPSGIRIEIKYLLNGCFMPDNYILNNAYKLIMPVWMVQGRYDMVCPPIAAYNLNKKLPAGHLIWVIAGHSSGDRAIYDQMKTTLLQLTEQ
ncbi:MAG TPA: alpha/beta fold hydrolase [Candidatus Saccharimonadales bacterium]|nr:alpha/beta fold hydrolase [Candidatus Saccharimonadales bacterium]